MFGQIDDLPGQVAANVQRTQPFTGQGVRLFPTQGGAALRPIAYDFIAPLYRPAFRKATFGFPLSTFRTHNPEESRGADWPSVSTTSRQTRSWTFVCRHLSILA